MVVKICGMRDPKNIQSLLELPVDLMGLIFYKKSPRHVPDSAASEILQVSDGKVKRVGVFVNEDIRIILQKAAKFKLSFVQLHGKESPDYCYDLLAASAKTFGCDDELQIIKAFSVDEKFDFSITSDYSPYCKYFIFDTKGKNAGGNGFKFDWSLLDQYTAKTPFLLSGGIGSDAGEAINSLDFPKMIGVDLNSKFEIQPALKDVDLLKQFLKTLKQNRDHYVERAENRD